MWLMVMSLHVWTIVPDAVRSGNAVRETVATVLFFKSMIYIVSEVKKWVPEDDAKVSSR